jgi:hypothetical protein
VLNSFDFYLLSYKIIDMYIQRLNFSYFACIYLLFRLVTKSSVNPIWRKLFHARKENENKCKTMMSSSGRETPGLINPCMKINKNKVSVQYCKLLTYTGLVQDQIATQLLGQQWSESTPMVIRRDGN